MLQSIYTHAGCDEIGHPVWTLFDVSIHTPTQGVTLIMLSASLPSRFQSTHPRRVWPQKDIEEFDWLSVSIHTPTQGVTFTSESKIEYLRVSIHTPTQGVTATVVYYLRDTMFQSTHPRRVWLPDSNHDRNHIIVSIHTPTQGVTPLFVNLKKAIIVSIHTPTQGVTLAKVLRNGICKFQSTHPRRVWRCWNKFTSNNLRFQSTHPRRVWLPTRIRRPIKICFNPHTHAGCDGIDGETLNCFTFQSTHPRRVWPYT